MKLGNFEIYAISDGFFRLDGGAMFGRVPREIWKKTNPPDKQNRILMALRCLLIKTGKSNILIDTGIGEHNQKIIERFAIDHSLHLKKSLIDCDLLPSDIDIVINTHLHFDHCGGNLLFPESKFFIQRAERQEALSDNPLTKASYKKEFFLPLYESNITGYEECEIEPGIALLRTGGHSLGHQIVKIQSEGQAAIYLGDLVPTASHLNYPFVMAYDIEPLETIKKKMEILPKAVEDHALLIFEHEPKFDAAFIKIEENKVLVAEEVNL